jgi:hypothetical protein
MDENNAGVTRPGLHYREHTPTAALGLHVRNYWSACGWVPSKRARSTGSCQMAAPAAELTDAVVEARAIWTDVDELRGQTAGMSERTGARTADGSVSAAPAATRPVLPAGSTRHGPDRTRARIQPGRIFSKPGSRRSVDSRRTSPTGDPHESESHYTVAHGRCH